jgi:hypothetical protein
LFACWLAGVTAQALARCEVQVPLERVSPHAWRVPAARGDPDAGNGGLTTQLVVVRDGERVWLLGSGPTPAFGVALACSVRRLLGRGVTDVVNARAAPELAMGNLAFEGARLWALRDVADMMRARCERCRDRLQARIGETGASLRPDAVRVPFMPVDRAGDDAGTLGPFRWVALARTEGERVLVLRHGADRLVVAPGLLWAGDVPDLRETDDRLLLASLMALRGFAAGARVLGEQGEPSRVDAVDAHVDYLLALRAAIAPRLRSGDERAAMGQSVDLPAFQALPGYAFRHPLNVQRVYREMETELLR